MKHFTSIKNQIPFGKYKGERFKDKPFLVDYYIKNGIATFSKEFMQEMEDYKKKGQEEISKPQTAEDSLAGIRLKFLHWKN